MNFKKENWPFYVMLCLMFCSICYTCKVDFSNIDIIIFIKIIITVILLVLTFRCYNFHLDFIKQYESNIIAYKNEYLAIKREYREVSKYNPELLKNAEAIANQMMPITGKSTTEILSKIGEAINKESQNYTNMANTQVEHIDKEEEKIKIENSNLLKEIIPLLSAISLMWIGKSF